jgi:predicted nuclease of predicted toxin-antitoxin system
MSLRFFTDHCVPNSIIQALRDARHTVLVLKEHIPRESDDAVVIAKAQELNALLVSLNGDFSDITAYPPSEHKGIIALQVRNRPEMIPSLLLRLMNYLTDHPEMPGYKGQLFLVEAHRIRIRK